MSALGDYLLQHHQKALFNVENDDAKDAALEVIKEQDEALKEAEKAIKPFSEEWLRRDYGGDDYDHCMFCDKVIAPPHATIHSPDCIQQNIVTWLKKYGGKNV